jgi:hypothetical protein
LRAVQRIFSTNEQPGNMRQRLVGNIGLIQT